MTGESSLGLLALLHPTGAVERVVILGAAGPAVLLPDAVAGIGVDVITDLETSAGTGVADVVVVAPSPEELADRRWLDRAFAFAAVRIAADGVVLVLVPPAARRQSRRLVERVGWRIERTMLALPNWGSVRYLLPLDRRVLPRTIDHVLPYTWWRRWAARGLAIPGIAAMLGRWHWSALLVVQPPGAPPSWDWLVRALGTPGNGIDVLLSAKWRAGTGSVILHAFDRAGRKAALAKTTLTATGADHRTMREVECLRHAGASARMAGARVPDGRIERAGRSTMLVETIIPGECVATLLQTRRLSLDVWLNQLTDWLAAWHRATAVHQVIDHDALDRMVLQPVRALAPALDGRVQYLAWLEARCRDVAGTAVPLVATHGDLTMSNVLLNERQEVGVVDWEAAALHGLPLRDFFYAAVDAAAAVERYTDRAAVFQRAMSPGHPLGRTVARHGARLAEAIEMPEAFATICFHACWAQHALDEQRKRKPGEAKPFRAIVAMLAANPRRFRDLVEAVA